MSITQRLGLFGLVCVTSFCLLVASQLLPRPAYAAPSLPTSCQEIQSVDSTAVDGTYTIYSNGIGYEVFCHDMDAEPLEYITLAVSGEGSNYSTSIRDGILIETYFSKLRINPLNLLVITNDYTFAENSSEVERNSKVPYGEGHSCSWDYGRANIDLRGTAFAVTPDQFVADGWDASGNAEYSNDNQVVNMWANGWCGFIAPYGSSEGEGGEVLQLQLNEGQEEPGESEVNYATDLWDSYIAITNMAGSIITITLPTELDQSYLLIPSDFEIFVNQAAVEVRSVEYDRNNSNIISIILRGNHNINDAIISMTVLDQALRTDGQLLSPLLTSVTVTNVLGLDRNNNGLIEIDDVVKLLHEGFAIDMNNDGQVTHLDIRLILQLVT